MGRQVDLPQFIEFLTTTGSSSKLIQNRAVHNNRRIRSIRGFGARVHFARVHEANHRGLRCRRGPRCHQQPQHDHGAATRLHDHRHVQAATCTCSARCHLQRSFPRPPLPQSSTHARPVPSTLPSSNNKEVRSHVVTPTGTTSPPHTHTHHTRHKQTQQYASTCSMYNGVNE